MALWLAACLSLLGCRSLVLAQVPEAYGPAPESVWLEDCRFTFGPPSMPFGSPQRAAAVGGRPLTIAGVRYAHGVGTHAVSTLTLDLRGLASRFVARVGVDDEPKTHAGSVEFRVVGDGRLLWSSGIVAGADSARPVEVDLTGVETLELVAADAGDGMDSDHADWADARILSQAPLTHLVEVTRMPCPTERWRSPEALPRGCSVSEVLPGVWRLRMGEPEAFTPVALRSAEPRAEALAAMAPPETMPFALSEVAWASRARGCQVSLPLRPGEQLFGFGLSMRTVVANGLRKVMRVSDSPETDAGDSHAPAPYYVSSRGYAVLVDTHRWATFNCGNLVPVPGEAPAAKRVDVDIPAARGVDVYVFAGPRMMDAVRRYNLFSGGGCLPPLWGLGVWYRGSADFTAQDALRLADAMRKAAIPCDVFGLEPGWQTHAYSCTFAWDAGRFPDPAGFVGEMSRRHYRVNLWEHAFTHPDSPIYEALKPLSGDYEVWGGLVPDFSLPQTREVFGGYHAREFVEAGVSGFKLDECDNQPLSATPWSFPERSAFPSGADGEQMHSAIGPLYQRALWEPYQAANRRTYGQVRASHALAAPLPYVLYSDAYDHRCYVRGLVAAGFSGLLWQPEVRDCGSVQELYRRLQTAVFSPQTLVNAWYLRNFPWRQIHKDENNRGELMPGYEQVEAVCRRLFELRMSLIPYLYSAFCEYHLQGTPPFRSLVLDYPDDPETYALSDEYLVGPSLLVAPAFTGETSREVYLPEGVWYDFWTGHRFEGRQRVRVEAPEDRIPVFVRENTLLPLAEPVQWVADDTCFRLTVRVYGPAPADFVLYEDDGVTLDAERGAQSVVTLGWSPEEGGQVRRTGTYEGPARYEVSAFDPVAAQ